jgi:hypothetical protein
VFTVEERKRVRAHLLATAQADPRVVAAAEVGSLAVGGGDRWSDLDLTFAVADAAAVSVVLGDWTQNFERELGAVRLFDLPVGATIYRVFLFPGLLQVDVSFTPASEFRARGPKFALLFGDAGAPAHVPPPSAHELLGLAVHHAVRARFSIERGRLWQAEYLIGQLREHTLELACLRLGLPARYGRGVDGLPSELKDAFAHALVRAVDKAELRRALRRNVEALLQETAELGESATRLAPPLRALLA